MMKQLKHNHIVSYLGTAMKDDSLYVFLEYVPGGSLHSMLREFGKLDEEIITVYTHQILLGLRYLHKKHIIHRDIKGGS